MKTVDGDSIINENSRLQVVILGIFTFLTIVSVSLLHANQYEFISLRFGITGETAYFDSILYLSYLIVGIIIGVLADRVGKRKIFIIIGCLGSILFYSLMILATNYVMLLIFRFCQGSFTIISWQILMTLVLDVSNSENRGKNLGIFGIFLALAMGLGPMFGGFIADYNVFVPYCIAIAANSIVFVGVLTLLKEPSHLKKRPSLKDNITIVNRAPELIIPGIFNFIDRLHMGFIVYALPLFIPVVLGYGPSIRGIILGIYAIPFIILQYPVGKYSDKHGRYKILILGSLGFGIMLSFAAYFGSFGLGILIFWFVILGILSGVTGPPSMALVGDFVESEDNAMGMGFFNFLGNVGIILGPIFGGLFAPHFLKDEFIFAFFIAGLVELISLAICILLILKFRGSLRSKSL